MSNDDTVKREGLEYGLFTGADIYQKVMPKEPIIEGMFNKGDNLVITSLAGTGKSILALQLVCNLTSGTAFLDTYHVPKKRSVLYVQTEGDRAETIGRLLHMRKALQIDDSLWGHFNTPGLTLNTEAGLKYFLDALKSTSLDYDVIIIDPLYPTVKGSLSSDDVVTDWQRATRVIRETYKQVSFIVFHHDTVKENWQKGRLVEKSLEDIFGSSMWGAWMSANYKMSVVEGIHKLRAGKGGGHGRTGMGVSEVSMRLMEPTPLYYVIDEDGLNETTMKILAVFKMTPEKIFMRKELEKIVDKTKATVCRALKLLCESNRLERLDVDGLTYYRIKMG